MTSGSHASPPARRSTIWVFIEQHEAEEAVQVALPEVQDKLRTYNAYGKVIAPRKTAKK